MTTAIAAALVAGSTSQAAPGAVLVTAYAVGGLPPHGVKVIANGDTVCEEIPCRFELDPGEHWVTTVAPGYERPSPRRVHVSDRSESNLHFELVPRR